MSDINIEEELDLIDISSVIIYRLSFLIAALIILSKIAFPQYFHKSIIGISMISAINVHIYDKVIRTTIQWIAVVSVVLFLSNSFNNIAVGAAFTVYCALAIKEFFCFKLKLLLAVPIILPIFWISIILQIDNSVMNIFAIISSILLVYLGFMKCKMPIYYDIGDKSKFQI